MVYIFQDITEQSHCISILCKNIHAELKEMIHSMPKTHKGNQMTGEFDLKMQNTPILLLLQVMNICRLTLIYRHFVELVCS